VAPSKYHSPRRADAAAATRAAILAAARDLFLSDGYAGTTVPQIARAARVAVPTVYTSIGSKAEILAALIEPVLRDPAVGEVMSAVAGCEDAVQIVTLTGEGVRLAHSRNWDTVDRLFPQAQSEPAAAATYQGILVAYQQALRVVAERLAALGALRPGLTGDDAADVLWFYFGERAWSALCHDRAWSFDEARDWLVARVVRELLPAGPPDKDETRSGGRSGSRQG
jgi:AcrR family transcriptional regulator